MRQSAREESGRERFPSARVTPDCCSTGGTSAGDIGSTVTWVEYWNGTTTLYVNARHIKAHYEAVTRDILGYLPAHDARVVDYGCGNTLGAGCVAKACGHLFLCDSAPSVRDQLISRYAGVANISVITPQQFEDLPTGAIDLIIANSVVQYLSASEFGHLLAVSRGRLSPDGRLVLADVIPRHVGPVRDAVELLKFARANGFLLSAAAGLVRSYFSSYRKFRERFGLLKFDELEFLRLLSRSGFVACRRYPNVGHNTRRMTFLASLRKAGASARASAHMGSPRSLHPRSRDGTNG